MWAGRIDTIVVTVEVFKGLWLDPGLAAKDRAGRLQAFVVDGEATTVSIRKLFKATDTANQARGKEGKEGRKPQPLIGAAASHCSQPEERRRRLPHGVAAPQPALLKRDGASGDLLLSFLLFFHFHFVFPNHPSFHHSSGSCLCAPVSVRSFSFTPISLSLIQKKQTQHWKRGSGANKKFTNEHWVGVF